MFSLYFNCRLVGSSLHKKNTLNSFSFYPIQHPKIENENQFQILIKSIQSLNKLTFLNCIFNIEIDDMNEKKEKLLNEAIKKNINYKNSIFLNYKRPGNKTDWIKDIQKYRNLGFNEPFIINMNHDHLYVDHQKDTFEKLVELVFKKNKYKKVLKYSHIPEAISQTFNSKNIYNSEIGNIYINRKINYWIDCLYIMNLDTLVYVFKKLQVLNNQYLGRFDWPNTYFNKLGITSYTFSREFFRHYDGYSHMTGDRNHELTYEYYSQFNILNFQKIESAAFFYFKIWKQLYFFYLRDNLPMYFNFKKKLIKLIEFTIDEFTTNYIKNDFISKCHDLDVNDIKYELRNIVYFNLNDFFILLRTDSLLKNKSLIKILSPMINHKIKIKLKNLIR